MNIKGQHNKSNHCRRYFCIMSLNRKNILHVVFLLCGQIAFVGAWSQPILKSELVVKKSDEVIVGAQRTALYMPMLANKKVAIAGNHTSLIGHKHLVDSLLLLGVQIKKYSALNMDLGVTQMPASMLPPLLMPKQVFPLFHSTVKIRNQQMHNLQISIS